MFRGIVGIVKFVLAICLLPVIAAVTISFKQEITGMSSYHPAFYKGVFCYVFCHLFVFTPQAFYQVVQKIFSEIFKIVPILSRPVPLAVPLISTLLLAVYYICETFFSISGFSILIMFLVGFFLAFHVILTAQDLYDEDSNPPLPPIGLRILQ